MVQLLARLYIRKRKRREVSLEMPFPKTIILNHFGNTRLISRCINSVIMTGIIIDNNHWKIGNVLIAEFLIFYVPLQRLLEFHLL